MKYYLIFLIAIFQLFSNRLNAQGCSDAGICTIGNFKPELTDSSKQVNNTLHIGLSAGSADHSLSVLGAFLSYDRRVNNSFSVSIKVTSLQQGGKGLTTKGLSDIFCDASFHSGEKTKLTAGIKIPLNKSDKRLNGLSLPMDYQSSLGTLDLFAGISYQPGRLSMSFAIQQPVSQNKNEFLPGDFAAGSPFRDFQPTNVYHRYGDALLRVSYLFPISERINFTPSILPVIHLNDDKYTAASGIRRAIVGSQGLTLNLTANIDFELNSQNIIRINAGAPVISRDKRPDGLTRIFIGTLEFIAQF